MGVFTELENEFDDEIVEEFLAHFEIMKDAMQPAILALEEISQYKVRVDELFRIFHNIKSASGFLKLEVMHRLSTYTENALEKIRVLDALPSVDYVDWLLKIADQFEAWYLDLSNDNEKLTPLDFSIFNSPNGEIA